MRLGVDESLGGKLEEGLPEGSPADAHVPGKPGLVKLLSWLQPPVQDPLAQLVVRDINLGPVIQTSALRPDVGRAVGRQQLPLGFQNLGSKI